jgi:hypothetical protein
MDESPEPVRVLRGVLAVRPATYDRIEARRPKSTRVERLDDALRRFSVFAFSAIMHLLALLLLAEFVYLAVPVIEETFISAQLQRPHPTPDPPAPDAGELPMKDQVKAERAAEAPKVAERPAPPRPVPAAVVGGGAPDIPSRPEPVGVLETASDFRESDLRELSGLGLFEGRGPAGRRNAVGRYGGNEASEAAVELGLRWLAAHQSDDGRWSTGQFVSKCPTGDPCGTFHTKGGYDSGVTGLALLAFLGAGYTHREGAHQETVSRVIEWLKARQDSRGFFFDSSVPKAQGGMYGHGVCMFALGEACAMTGDESLKPILERAVKATEAAQQPGGGWYYTADPRDRGTEFTLSVWQIMGLMAAKKAGVPVGEATISRAKDFVRTSTDLSGGVFYTHQSAITAGSTGAGAFARCMLGMTDGGWVEKGLAYMDRQPDLQPSLQRQQQWEYLYSWYYRTLAGFQLQGRQWRDWNRTLRPFLVSTQHTIGHPAGSWSKIDYANAGTVYSTSMCILMLETYYRYPVVASVGAAEASAVAEIDEPMTAEEERRARMARPATPEDAARRVERERTDARAKVRSAKPEDRYIGARKLAELGDKESAPDMIAAAEKERGPLRAAHLLFIGRLKSEQAIPFLVGQLDDADENTRAAAMNALLRTTGVYIAEIEGWKRWFEDWKRRPAAPK